MSPGRREACGPSSPYDALVSGDLPPDQDPPDPFDLHGLGGLGGLGGLFQNLGGGSAKQLAMGIAGEGRSEPNVDPMVRMEYEQLARVAQLQVENHTGLLVSRSGPLVIEPLTRAGWAGRSVDAFEPLLDQMTRSLHDGIPGEVNLDDLDPDTAARMPWLEGMLSAMAPMMAGITTGTMVGRLAVRSLGSYDLPIPRTDQQLLVVAPNVEAFAAEWSLPVDDLRLWVCLHEAVHHALFGIPHVREAVTDLLRRHAGGFRSDPAALEDSLGRDLSDLFENLDPAAGPEVLADLQRMLDPDTVLGAVRSPEQEALLPHLEALVAAIVGYVDHVMDSIGATLIGNYPMVTEAMRRRRVETSEADRFVERILGLDLTQQQVDRGSAFVAGIVERAGTDGLGRLWEEARFLPTPSEIDAPGLWLARIDLPEA